ncbi:MAG TPA: hypothetical protein ENH29_02555 [Bacteroidetes bacterium]|nr:hypothetical protein [Bacteroidota bacterium]
MPTETLLLDAGGFNAGFGQLNKIKTEYLLRGYKMLGYSAVNLGYRDFLQGTKFLTAMQKEYSIPFVSANIYNLETKRPFVSRYLIKTVKMENGQVKLRVGIFGITEKNTNLIPERRRQGGAILEARDPVENAGDVTKQMNGRVDLIICLAHLRLEAAKKLAEQVPAIDVIILGNDFRNQAIEVNDGKTKIVSAGQQGKYMGDLRLYLDKDKKVVRYEHAAKALDKTYKDVKKFTDLVKQFKQESVARK